MYDAIIVGAGPSGIYCSPLHSIKVSELLFWKTITFQRKVLLNMKGKFGAPLFIGT